MNPPTRCKSCGYLPASACTVCPICKTSYAAHAVPVARSALIATRPSTVGVMTPRGLSSAAAPILDGTASEIGT